MHKCELCGKANSNYHNSTTYHHLREVHRELAKLSTLELHKFVVPMEENREKVIKKARDECFPGED